MRETDFPVLYDAMAFWSWRRDLNPRPADYKSAALPTELRQPVGKTRNLAEIFGIRNREFRLLEKIWAAGSMGVTGSPNPTIERVQPK